MRTVYKYEVELNKYVTIAMPLEAEILHFGLDYEQDLCIWAEVETERDTEARVFQIVGTGNEITNSDSFHLGSCVVGPYVWHLYEVPE
jgi:hypothetical protein